jgi:beta-mannosidase
MSRGIIPDPFYRFNEYKAVLHERTDWKYRKRFHLDRQQFKALMNRRVRLICQGLDTFAAIKLNRKPVGHAENMFVQHEFDIIKHLKRGLNELVILFESPLRIGNQLRCKHGRASGGVPFDIRSYVRKAQYSFGWDWGPELPTMGIWKNICIESWDARIRDVCFRTVKADIRNAEVQVFVELDIRKGEQYSCEITLGEYKSLITRTARKNSEVIAEKLTIKRPRLWMPNGYGKPNLYPLSVRLVVGGRTVDTRRLEVGIRTVELVQEKDDEGRSFCFRINGMPVYCKGANFIPADNFLHRTTDEKYRRLLHMAVGANMNMLRIWGGGIYEKDIFYSLCDRLGIMVWQDFMFACALYPHENFFLRNVENEARRAVRRLRNHPCITIWCGENENHVWFGEKPIKWGQKIYNDVLPRICKELDPTLPYTPGSPIGRGPIGGKDANGMREGDRHAWDVWSGWRDYYEYQNDTGRFQSEFGFQAPPTMETIRKYAAPEDLRPQSRWMEHHNKMGEGNPRLYKFLSDHFIVPTTLDEFVYLCQVNQGEALKIGVEHFRRRKFKTAGALIWQMNDCWPVTSWSLVDGESRPKLSYYYAKRFFAPVLLSIVEKDNRIEVWITNDTMGPIKGRLIVRSLEFTGRKIRSQSVNAKIPRNSSRRCLVTSRAKMNANSTAREFINAKLLAGTKVIAENNLFLDRTKYLALPEPEIDRSIERLTQTQFKIRLRSRTFVKACTLSFGRREVSFSDNCFDLLPDEEKTIICETKRKTGLKSLNSKIRIRSVRSSKTETS